MTLDDFKTEDGLIWHRDPDGKWRTANGGLCYAYSLLAIRAERERIILAVDEMCGSHNLTKRLRERVGAAT